MDGRPREPLPPRASDEAAIRWAVRNGTSCGIRGLRPDLEAPPRERKRQTAARKPISCRIWGESEIDGVSDGGMVS